MNRIIITGISLILFSVAVYLFCTNSLSAKTYNWKIHTFVPKPTVIYQKYLLPFVKAFDERTNGQIQLTLYPAGTIVAFFDLFVSTAEGVI